MPEKIQAWTGLEPMTSMPQKQTSLFTCSGRKEERGTIKQKLITYSILLYYQTFHTDLRCTDGAAEAELTTIQRFLDRCKKRRYISYSIDIHDLLENKIKIYALNWVMGLEGHPLYNILPEVQNNRYQLRRKSAVKPKVNTKRFMSSFVNRLIFKYEFAP